MAGETISSSSQVRRCSSSSLWRPVERSEDGYYLRATLSTEVIFYYKNQVKVLQTSQFCCHKFEPPEQPQILQCTLTWRICHSSWHASEMRNVVVSMWEFKSMYFGAMTSRKSQRRARILSRTSSFTNR